MQVDLIKEKGISIGSRTLVSPIHWSVVVDGVVVGYLPFAEHSKFLTNRIIPPDEAAAIVDRLRELTGRNWIGIAQPVPPFKGPDEQQAEW